MTFFNLHQDRLLQSKGCDEKSSNDFDVRKLVQVLTWVIAARVERVSACLHCYSLRKYSYVYAPNVALLILEYLSIVNHQDLEYPNLQLNFYTK